MRCFIPEENLNENIYLELQKNYYQVV